MKAAVVLLADLRPTARRSVSERFTTDTPPNTLLCVVSGVRPQIVLADLTRWHVWLMGKGLGESMPGATSLRFRIEQTPMLPLALGILMRRCNNNPALFRE